MNLEKIARRIHALEANISLSESTLRSQRAELARVKLEAAEALGITQRNVPVAAAPTGRKRRERAPNGSGEVVMRNLAATPLFISEIMKRSGQSRHLCEVTLSKAAREGRAVRIARGCYALPPTTKNGVSHSPAGAGI